MNLHILVALPLVSFVNKSSYNVLELKIAINVNRSLFIVTVLIGLTTSISQNRHFIALFSCSLLEHCLLHIVGTLHSLILKKFGNLSVKLCLGLFFWSKQRTEYSKERFCVFI